MISFDNKGIRINADIRVHEYKPYYGSTFEFGFVQILESSLMKTVYASSKVTGLGKTVVIWKQETLPCYDSTNDQTIPWYHGNNPNWNSHDMGVVAQQGQVEALALEDFPSLHVEPFLNRPGHRNNGQPLQYAIKRNSFSVYMLMRERLGGHTKHKWIIKHGAWDTEIEVKAKANWANNVYDHTSYQVLSDKITHTVTSAKPKTALFSVPNKSTKSANDNQKAAKNRVQHHALHVFWDLK